MTQSPQVEQRRERAVFETERHQIAGDVTLPRDGYASRFSDALNRAEVGFLPLTDVEITETATGEVTRRAFVVLAKSHVRFAYPVDAGAPGSGA